MPDDFQIRPMVGVLVRRGRVALALLALTVLAMAALTLFVFQPVYQASASIVVVQSRSQITFDPKYRTLSSDELSGFQDRQAQQKGLIALADNGVIATQVISQLGTVLDPALRAPDTLRKSIIARDQGDVIEITAEAETPEKAAAIANAWAKQYEAYVNQVFGNNSPSPEDLRRQVEDANQKYQAAQTALNEFLKTNASDALSRALTQKQNQISDAYATQRRIERLMGDAQSIRRQLEQGISPATVANNLSAILLQASAATLSTQIPVDQTMQAQGQVPQQINNAPPMALQVTIDPGSGSAASSREQTMAQVNALLTVLQQRHDDLDTFINSGKLQQDIQTLQSQVEQANARQRELSTARDRAWDTFQTLARKQAEVDVSSNVHDIEVRLAATATPPQRPVRPNKLLSLALAVVLGSVLGVAGSFAVEGLNGRRVGMEPVRPTP